MGRIFWKLFAAMFLTVILAFISAVAFFTLSDQDIGQIFIRSKAAYFLDLGEAVAKDSGIASVVNIVNVWNQSSDKPHFTVLNPQGKSLSSQLFSTEGTRRDIVTSDGKTYVLVTDVKAAKENFDRPSVTVPLLSGALFGFIVSAFLAWYFTLPIRHLRWALEEVSKGKFETRVSALMGSRRDEIADLGRDVDLMTSQLEELVSSRQRLFHDISHELRSPLTRLQVASGLLRQNPAKTNVMLERIDKEIVRLNDLVEQILTLARLSSQTDFKTDDSVDVIELLSSIIDDAAFEAKAINKDVRFMFEGSFISLVNGEMLCRSFENVIRNAVKYTREGTTINVQASYHVNQKELHVSVEDYGIGISHDKLAKIFEPFWRYDTDHPSVGFGLGLAIAQKAIEAHHGQVWAENVENGGLRINIIIPQNGT